MPESWYREAAVRSLVGAVELRDEAIGSHLERVCAVALELAAVVAPDLATNPALRYGFLLHDDGKIGIPDCVLHKPGPLAGDELLLMQTHPLLGELIIQPLTFLDGVARDVIVCHHERWDGLGYPYRRRGDETPLAARIFAIADAYDAMTTDRPYRAALTHDEAIRRIEEASGTQFDPVLGETFVTEVRAIDPFGLGRLTHAD